MVDDPILQLDAQHRKVTEKPLRRARHLRCMLLNVRSLSAPSKCDALCNYSLLHDIDLFLLTETWLSSTITDSELSLGGRYVVYRMIEVPEEVAFSSW